MAEATLKVRTIRLGKIFRKWGVHLAMTDMHQTRDRTEEGVFGEERPEGVVFGAVNSGIGRKSAQPKQCFQVLITKLTTRSPPILSHSLTPTVTLTTSVSKHVFPIGANLN